MKSWIEDDNINYEYIIRYIRDTIPRSEGHIREMEEYAKLHEVPISQPESIRMIEVLLKLSGVRRVLEVGCAIGYSSIRMCRACGGEVVTVELSDEINVIRGDAKDVLPRLAESEKFDMIFVDAAKGQYMEFFPHCMKMLNEGGLLISDNILYKGMTATDELLVRRKVTIVRRLRKYLEMLRDSSELSTAIIPIGDGVAISYKERK